MNDPHRWTLTTTNAAILSGVLAMLVAFALGRLFFIVYTTTHIFVLRRKTKTIFDDQANVIAANTENPSAFTIYLLRLCAVARRRALASTVCRILLIMALIFLL